jgi:hypothetical protein
MDNAIFDKQLFLNRDAYSNFMNKKNGTYERDELFANKWILKQLLEISQIILIMCNGTKKNKLELEYKKQRQIIR